MVNAATREKMATLDEELEQMRIKLARIDKASEAQADVRSSLRPSAEEEEDERQRLQRARAPITKAQSKHHEQRYSTPEESEQQKLLKKAKAGWRQHDEHKKMLGKLEFLHHLETAFGYDEATEQRVVHKPFEGKLHLICARGLKDADMFDKSDPYVEVRWNGELIGKTRVCEGNTDPVFEEMFVIRVSPTQANELSVEVFDFDGDMFAMRAEQKWGAVELQLGGKTDEKMGKHMDGDDAQRLAKIREASERRREEMEAAGQEPDFLGEVVLAGEGSQMLPEAKTEYTLQRKPGRDGVRVVGNRNITDTYNVAVGGFITFWFEGHEEAPEPTAMQVELAEARGLQGRMMSPEESGRARRKKGKSRAELENAKRPFAFRTDPVNLAFAEIKSWGDIPGLAEERGYRPWDEVAKGQPDSVLHAGVDVGKRQEWELYDPTDREGKDDGGGRYFITRAPSREEPEYKPPSEGLCPECKLVPPTAPKENVMGKTMYDGLCDLCGGRVVAKKRTSVVPSLDMGGRRIKKKTPEPEMGGRRIKKKTPEPKNPWAMPKEEAEKFERRSASVMGTVIGGVLNGGTKLVANGRRAGSVSPSRMAGASTATVDDGSSLPGPNVKPRLGRPPRKAPPRGEAQGQGDKLHRTMANWGAPVLGAGPTGEQGFPTNWPSAYPDYGLPFTSGVPHTKKALIDKLTNSDLYTGTHKHRFDAEGKGRGLAGRDFLAKGEGSVVGRRAAHQGLALRQGDAAALEQTINWGASGNLNQVFSDYQDGFFFRDGFHAAPKGSKVPPRGLVVDDAICLSNNDLGDWIGFVPALQPLLCMGTMASLHRLDLSHNRFMTVSSELADACINLQVLNLHANQIPSLGALNNLTKLKRLEQISLHGNPLECEVSGYKKELGKGVDFANGAAGRGRYRSDVVALLPWLKQLDFTSISPTEREQGLRMRRIEADKEARRERWPGEAREAPTRTMIRKSKADRERR